MEKFSSNISSLFAGLTWSSTPTQLSSVSERLPGASLSILSLAGAFRSSKDSGIKKWTLRLLPFAGVAAPLALNEKSDQKTACVAAAVALICLGFGEWRASRTSENPGVTQAAEESSGAIDADKTSPVVVIKDSIPGSAVSEAASSQDARELDEAGAAAATSAPTPEENIIKFVSSEETVQYVRDSFTEMFNLLTSLVRELEASSATDLLEIYKPKKEKTEQNLSTILLCCPFFAFGVAHLELTPEIRHPFQTLQARMYQNWVMHTQEKSEDTRLLSDLHAFLSESTAENLKPLKEMLLKVTTGKPLDSEAGMIILTGLFHTIMGLYPTEAEEAMLSRIKDRSCIDSYYASRRDVYQATLSPVAMGERFKLMLTSGTSS